MSTTPKTVVRDYYEALREGRPLEPYFVPDESTVKFGISEQLYGYDDVAGALSEQTETTDNWSVESTNLVVTTRGEYATIADEVIMAWTNTDTGDRHRFETRWSGTLGRRTGTDVMTGAENGDDDRPAWQFQTMHVSARHEL